MRHPLPVLLVGLVTAPSLAGGGSITFAGDIREPTCPVLGGQVSCSRPAAFEPPREALPSVAQVPLLAYALARTPGLQWRVIDIVYR